MHELEFEVVWIIQTKGAHFIEGKKLIKATCHLQAKEKTIIILMQQYYIARKQIKIISIEQIV